jgi:adenylate cyclase, class 2
MMNSEMEIEAKFYVKDIHFYENRLSSLGAVCTQPRTYEVNLRFDLPDRSLTDQHRVLRLRQDTRTRLTYKGPGQALQTVSKRQEIEFEVGDFESARHFLEALGYEVSIMYEKYRATYQLDVVEVALDEMPFGTFIEIEGPDEASIQVAAAVLRLNWNARCAESYLALFNRLCLKQNLKVANLSFKELEGVIASGDDLGIDLAG